MANVVERRPELLLGAVTLVWSSTFIITKDIVRDTAPLFYLTLRFTLGAALLLALFPRALRPSRKLATDGLLLGAGQALGLALQVFGQVFTTASKSAFVTAFATALTPLLALGLYRERPSRAQWLGVVLATSGLVLLTYPSAQTSWNVGDLFTVVCAFVYAGVIVETARRAQGADVGVLVVLQTAAAALCFGLAFVVAHGAAWAIEPARWPALLRIEARPLGFDGKFVAELSYMALVCTAGTFLAQTWAMARMSATHAAVVFALEPVFATGMAIAVEGSSEWPGPRGAAGAGLVVGGVLASEMRRLSRS
jgi:drug/metabolite transporter (DMT)-like permease